jgi:hypothetical protein
MGLLPRDLSLELLDGAVLLQQAADGRTFTAAIERPRLGFSHA